MIKNKKILAFLFLYFLILIYPIKSIPLFETTEARYAEIAREMIENNNFIEPKLNGIKHFHKPPFSYWMIALGEKIFGINGFGARFFGIIAALIVIIFLYKISEIFFKENIDKFNTLLILSSNFLFLSISRVTSTDIYLTMWTTIAQYFLFNQIYVRKSFSNLFFYSIALSFGFITKGPIIFLFTLLPYLTAKFFDENHRKVFSTKEVITGIIIFLLIALPWYIIVIIKNPELLSYFLKVQTIDRVATNRFHRYQPFYFFIVVFIALFFPYSIYFLKATLNFKSIENKFRILLIYFLLPFIIFSVSKSKLITYILPLIPLSSIFAYYSFKNFNSSSLKNLSGIVIFLMITALAFSGYFYKPFYLYRYSILLYSLIVLITSILIFIKSKQLLNFFAFCLISVSFIVYLFLPKISSEIKGYNFMCYEMNKIDPNRELNVLLYKVFLPSISFYRNKIAITAYSKEREVSFENDTNYKKYYLTTDDEIKQFIAENKKFLLVTEPQLLNEFNERFKTLCFPIFKQRKHWAYNCNLVN